MRTWSGFALLATLGITDAQVQRKAKTVSAGVYHTCALLDDSTAKCFGMGWYGQLGSESSVNIGDVANQPVGGYQEKVIPIADIKQVAAGGYHTCAVLVNDTLKCVGFGQHGQLGSESKANYGYNPNDMKCDPTCATVDLGPARTVKQVVAGKYHTCVVLDDDTLKCFGFGERGQLGTGAKADIGTNANEMGGDLPIVDLGSGRTVKQVAAGGYHTCVVLDDGTSKCFGFGKYGQLGSESNGNAGSNANEMGGSLPILQLGSGRTAKQVSAGEYHTCVVLDDDALKCFGFGEWGQLGSGSKADIGVNANQMRDYLPIVDLGSGRTVKQVAAGGYHTCVVLDDGTLKCFGLGEYGQLGSESNAAIGNSANHMGDNLPIVNLGGGRTAKQVSSGEYHTCVVLDDDTLKCFGLGQYGQLGSRAKANIGSNANEMGGYLSIVDLQTRNASCPGINDGCDHGDDGQPGVYPMLVGEGDCDEDVDCAAGLICGYNNCEEFRSSIGWPRDGPSWDRTDDCCYNPGRDYTCWEGLSGQQALIVPTNWTVPASEPDVSQFPKLCLHTSLVMRFTGASVYIWDQKLHDIRYLMQRLINCLFPAQVVLTNYSRTDCEWRCKFFLAFAAESVHAQKQALTLLESFKTDGSVIYDRLPPCADAMAATETDLEAKLGLAIFKVRISLIEFTWDEGWPEDSCSTSTTSSSGGVTTSMESVTTSEESVTTSKESVITSTIISTGTPEIENNQQASRAASFLTMQDASLCVLTLITFCVS